MNWHFDPHSIRPPLPVENDEEPLFVVPNQTLGGYSLRFANSSLLIGRFLTPGDAEKYARSQTRNVRVLVSIPTRDQQPTFMPTNEKAIRLIRHT
jgi:hypothetical protein